MLNAIQLEKLAVLLGERGDGKQSAMLRGDLNLVPMTAKPAAGATVTVEEYNALVNDMERLRAALKALTSR